MSRLNIAIAGGPCTGKSVLAAALFASQKVKGLDYDLIPEQGRMLKREFGQYRSPFERLYMWRQQMREEDRSNATDGFITDTPLFSFYTAASMHVQEDRDKLAVRELYRWWTEVGEDRYHLIVVAENPDEIPYKTDGTRKGDIDNAREKHRLVRTFVEHYLPNLLLLVSGNVQERVSKVEKRLAELRGD